MIRSSCGPPLSWLVGPQRRQVRRRQEQRLVEEVPATAASAAFTAPGSASRVGELDVRDNPAQPTVALQHEGQHQQVGALRVQLRFVARLLTAISSAAAKRAGDSAQGNHVVARILP